MGLPACFHLADNVFPRVRAEAARRLIASGWSQSKAASLLHVSQAMVSKYVARDETEDDGLVLHLVDELMESLKSPLSATGPSDWCRTLNPTDGRDGSQETLDDLLGAERMLTEAPPTMLVPQIGLNIACAAPQASGPTDILAFPGRLVMAGDRLVSPVPPAWGASNHLAACLLALRKKDDRWTALANIRGGPEIMEAAGRAGIAAVEVDRSGDLQDAPVLHRFKQGHAFVHDPGAIGIEPCLYIAGRSAKDVAKAIRVIHSESVRVTA